MVKRKGRKSVSEIDEIEALKRDLQKARSKGQWKEVSDLLNRLGSLHREIKQFEDALDYHQEEVEITKKYFPKDRIGLAIAFRAKAEVYIEMKDEETALPLVLQYLKLAKTEAHLVEEQRAHVTLGRVYLGLAIKYSESTDETTGEDSKGKALEKAETEFRRARELANSKKMEEQKLGAELNDMRCGVLLNIAIVLDMKANLEGSRQCILKAIEIARANKFYEHLFRSHVNLCDVYTKMENYKEARLAAEEAGKAGKCLENVNMVVDARVLEAKVFYLLDDIGNGVRALKKLRKCILAKHAGSSEQLLEDVEPLLKSGVRITRNEDKLHMTDKSDYPARQKLYESLGDNYVEIGNFGAAVAHYQNSIENGEKANLSEKELSKLYFSVAATYRDKGDDSKALQYFLKEIQLHGNNPSEAFKTQTNITISLEKIPSTTREEVLAAHEKALDLAIACDCPKKKVAALSNYSSYLKSIGREAQSSELKRQVVEIRELYHLAEDGEEPDSQDLLNEEDADGEDDIDLDQLTSENETSDEEDKDTKVPAKKKKFHVNEKGETALHRAAIKGDVKIVSRLLRQGHNVNARDMGGWLPLHEACNFGYLDVVKELLKNGAKVNQPSDRVCNELTPLHDAANNGHTAIILQLLKYKANVLALDTKGNCPLDLLIAWRERIRAEGTELEPDDLQTYRDVRSLMMNLMEKAGRRYDQRDELRARRTGKLDTDGPDFELVEGKSKADVPIPVRLTVEDYDPDDAGAAVDLYSTTIRGLRGRRRRGDGSRQRDANDEDSDGDREPNRTAEPIAEEGLIPASQFVDDDWLVDGGDLPSTSNAKTPKQNKRKRDPMEEIRCMDARNLRRRREGQRNDLARLDIGQEVEESSEELIPLDEDEEPVVNLDDHTSRTSFDFHSADPILPRSTSNGGMRPFSEILNDQSSGDGIDIQPYDEEPSSRSKKSRNPIVLSSDEEEHDGLSLYHRMDNEDVAFPRPSTSTTSSKGNRLSRKKTSRVFQSRLPFKTVQNNPEEPSSLRSSRSRDTSLSPPPAQLQRIPQSKTTLRLKIRVNEKVFMVPVVQAHLNESIDWLSEECARRYFDSYGVKPILTLRTKDGAILSAHDIIRVVLPESEIELDATVVSFDLQRLPERFKSAAIKTPGLKYEEEILVGLEVCQSSNNLRLSGCDLRNKVGQTLFQALQYQNALRELYLPDCSLHNNGVKSLSSILSTLPNLTALDLSCNGITSSGIQELSEAFKNGPEDSQHQRQCCNLTWLDLSFNPLGHSAGPPLTNLLSQLTQLRNLMLASCDLNVRLFTESRLGNTFSKLKLEEIDISYNEWGKKGLDTILQSLTPGRLRKLSCASSNVEDEENFGRTFSSFLSRNEDCCNLKELVLTDCSLGDSDIAEISCQFGRLVRLESLTLRNNDDVTLSSLEVILNECVSNSIPLTHLDFRSCPNLWRLDGASFTMQRVLTSIEKKLGSEKKLEALYLSADIGANSETVETSNLANSYEEKLSEKERRIARLWEEYAGSSPFTCTRAGNSISFVYER